VIRSQRELQPKEIRHVSGAPSLLISQNTSGPPHEACSLQKKKKLQLKKKRKNGEEKEVEMHGLEIVLQKAGVKPCPPSQDLGSWKRSSHLRLGLPGKPSPARENSRSPERDR